MFFYKLIIAYDGTDYQGWQAQKNVPTIVNTLQHTFKKVFAKDVAIIGASRTDAGVHALNQVARAKINFNIDPDQLILAWNNSLPADITIKSIELTDASFHPIKKVKEKTYFYHFFTQRPSPFAQRYEYFYKWEIDLNKLEKCLKIFIGKHDFRSYSTGYEMYSTIRTINDISLIHIPEINIFRITITGKSFLHHMIRRIVGACLEVASKKNIKTEYLKEVLEEKNANQTLPNAPAKGLMLYKIEYE